MGDALKYITYVFLRIGRVKTRARAKLLTSSHFFLSVCDWSVKFEPNHGQHRCQNRIYVRLQDLKKNRKAAKTGHIGHIINNSKSSRPIG